MTKSEYQDLIEFLGKKFDALDSRQAGIEGRLTLIEDRLARVEDRLTEVGDRLAKVEDRLTRVEVLAEDNRHQIQILAEAVGGLRVKMDSEFAAVRREMAEGFRVQGNLIQDLGTRVGGLERRWA